MEDDHAMKYSIADLNKRLSPDIRELNPDLFEPLGVDAHRIIEEKLSEGEKKERGNKYGAKRTRIGDLVFDSRKEANRYLELKSQEEIGEISNLELQYEICLLEGFVYQGEKVRAIRYTADFSYAKNGIRYIEDVKSKATARTEAFRIRWRLLQWHFKNNPNVRCVLSGA